MKWRLILSSTLGTCWTTILHCVQYEKTNKQKCKSREYSHNMNKYKPYSVLPEHWTHVQHLYSDSENEGKNKKKKNDNVYNHMHSLMVAMNIRLNIHMWTFCFLMSDIAERQHNSFSLNIMHIRIILNPNGNSKMLSLHVIRMILAGGELCTKLQRLHSHLAQVVYWLHLRNK